MDKPQTKFAKPLEDCLFQEEGLKKLVEQAKKHQELTLAVKKVLARLGFQSACQALVVEWKLANPKEIALIPLNAAIGTKLQQLRSSIANALHQEGWSIEVIQIKIKPQASRSIAMPSDQPKFTSPAQAAWESLYQKLSPGSSLQQTVGRLLKNRKIKR